MSRTTTTNADFWSGTAPVTAVPAAGMTLFAWYKSTAIGADGQFISFDNNIIDSNTFALMVSSGGLAGAYTWSTSPSVQFATAAGVLPNSVWRFVAAVFASAASRTTYNNTTAGTNSGFVTPPTGITAMHYNGINNRGIPGEHAHRGTGLRSYNSIELAYLAAGGQPSNLGVEHYHQLDQSGTESDIGTSGSPITMTVHGTTAGSDDPDFASYWTAAALGAQSWTQGSAISNIDFTTKFRDVHSASTYTLKVLGAGSQVTSTVGAASTASNLMTVNGTGGISVGSYVSDGPAGTRYLVLFISGNTLLLNGFTTWANSDPIYAYTATTKTFTGLTLTAGVLSGTPAAGDVGSYSLIPRRTSNANSALIADGPAFAATVAASGAAPSFSAGPTQTSANTDGYSFSATSNQTATWYLVAMMRGSTGPTSAQVKSGSPTGFVARFSVALTATVGGVLSATGLTLPSYDLYHVVDNGSGTSAAVAQTNQLKAPPAGKQYSIVAVTAITAITKATSASITATAHGRTTGDWCQVYGTSGMVEINGTFLQCTVIDANTVTLPINSTTFTTYTSGGVLSWGKSRYAGGTTVPVTGDVGIFDQVSSPDGIPATVFAHGAMSLAVGSVTARQAINFDLQSVSLGGLVGAGIAYFNDQAPSVANSPFSVPGIFLPANQAIPNTSLAPYWVSPQSDTLTFTGSGLQSGLSISTPNLTGATAVAAILPISLTATDFAGKQTVGAFNLVIGQVNPPNLQNLTQPTVDPQLASIYLTATYASGPDPNPAGAAPAGTVIAQNPPFGVPVQPNTVINVTLSNGTSAGTVVTPPTGIRYSAQLTNLQSIPAGLNLAYLTGQNPYDAADVCQALASDAAGQQYRYFKIPSNARIIDLDVINDSNPAGSNYSCGIALADGRPGLIPSGAASIFFANASMDSQRTQWTRLYMPQTVGGVFQTVNLSKRVWELLNLTADPNQIYDLVVTAITPGQSGGYMALRLIYVQ